MTQIREKILSFGAFRLLPSRQLLFDGDQPVRIGSRALGLLQVLVENAGEVVSKYDDACGGQALCETAGRSPIMPNQAHWAVLTPTFP